jgi:hypothetical protein
MSERGSKEGQYDGTPIIKASGGNVIYVGGNYRVEGPFIYKMINTNNE